MNHTSPKASSHIFIWTALLTILLAAFAFLTILSRSKAETIKLNIRTLQTENNSYYKLDTCIAILYAAENNSRLFVVTRDSAYLHLYQNQLGTVSSILKNYETETSSHASQLSKLITSKEKKNEELVRLSMMVDSLVSFTFQTAQTKKLVSPPVAVRKTSVISQSSRQDTLITFPAKQKKRLVKRIMEAIRDKDTTAQAVLSASNNTVLTSDSSFTPSQPVIQTDRSVYENARRSLSKTEQELLALNGRIFTHLQQALVQLKLTEERQVLTLRKTLLHTTSSKFEEMTLLIWGSVILAAMLAAMIIRNLIKLYRKDVTIIEHAQLMASTTKRKGEMLAHMTHEIRTPLNSIIGFSQLMDSREMDDELRTNINAIKSSSEILLTLVNEILDFSKLETGKIQLQSKPFNVKALVDEAVSMLSVLADEKKIVLTSRLEADPGIYLCGDPLRIRQILINLLTNAIKFTPAGGKVDVIAGLTISEPEKGILELTVKDSGIGIESKYLHAIFEDYVQVEGDENRTVQTGTGLGLAICKRITDLYQGQISVDSKPGTGSEFRVKLPLTIAEKLPEKPADVLPVLATKPRVTVPLPEADDLLLNGKKILVVDDTRVNLLLMSRILDKLGATYDLVNDGQKAIDLFNENPYDLVITDVNMPVMDGIELTKRIRAHAVKRKAQIPVIGFTGSTEEDQVRFYKEIGIDEVIPKPVQLNYFKEVIDQLFLMKNNV